MTIKEFEEALAKNNAYASLTLVGSVKVVAYCAALNGPHLNGPQLLSDVEPTREAVIGLHNDLTERADEFFNPRWVGLDAHNRNAALTGNPVVKTIPWGRELELDTQLIV